MVRIAIWVSTLYHLFLPTLHEEKQGTKCSSITLYHGICLKVLLLLGYNLVHLLYLLIVLFVRLCMQQSKQRHKSDPVMI